MCILKREEYICFDFPRYTLSNNRKLQGNALLKSKNKIKISIYVCSQNLELKIMMMNEKGKYEFSFRMTKIVICNLYDLRLLNRNFSKLLRGSGKDV